jgi:hypothetical protein
MGARRRVLTAIHHPWQLDDDNVAVLTEAARTAPDAVMEVIGRAILDRDRRLVFGADEFQGLFEAIGVESVRRWVAAHGREHLRWIARHLLSPTLDAEGNVTIPPLTKWLFTECDDDQRAFEWFLMGRHHMVRAWVGDQRAQKRAEMAPFLSHKVRRVREWAEYEIRSEERETAYFLQRDEEDQRL